MLVEARAKQYAVGAFEFWSYDSARAVLKVAKDLGLPVKLVGVGEQIQDIRNFDSKEFINALFNQ